MADIRINSLPSTATSFNTDDYIAIDGASGGTRKMLAATLPLTDVTLGGSSGPSVKSSLSARAPRQGLVFDGTAGATIGTFSNWGTADFSICAWIRPSLSANAYILTPTSGSDMYFTVNSNGTLRVSSGGFTQDLTSTGTVSANKWALVSYVRSGTTATFYINGIAAGSGTDSFNWGRVTGVGSSGYVGTIAPVYPYNRALSASEVVALYEAGAPSGADYNSASNTAFNTSNFVEAIAYTTFTGVSATGFSATQTGAVTSLVVTKPNITINAGNRVLVTFTGTLTSGAVPNVALVTSANGVASNISAVAAGSNSVVLTATAPCVGVGFYTTGAATSYAISNVVATRLGLLLAPDAAQAGGGLVWYDTSGNAANITLPASGVSWNVPSSGYWGGNLTVSGTGTISGAINANADGTNIVFKAFGTTPKSALWTNNDGTMTWGDYATGTKSIKLNTTNGNATLAGNLTVSGTGTSSVAGSLGIGTTSPLANLHVANSTNGAGTFNLGGTTSSLGLQMEYYQGGYTTSTIYANTTYLDNAAALKIGVGKTSNPNQLVLLGSGNVLIGTTTDNSATFAANRTGTGPASSGAISTAAIRAVDVSNDLALDIGVNSAASPYPGWIQVHGRTNQATNYPLALNPNGGVVLVNTSANSGNGAVQLATHTTSAGGIGFGTDVALYRAAASTLKLELGVSGGVLWFDNGGSGTGGARIIGSSGALTVTSNGANSVYLQTGGTTALTLDSSQNATFAGTITGNKGSVINAVSGVPALRLEGTGAANSNYGLRINAGLSASDYGLFVVDDTSTDAYFIVRGDGTAKFWKNTEVAGALAIGNTVQTAAAVASTHKVTISIGGTTYYLLATNV